jgi:outer membrane protein assembly factor BamB
MRHENGLRHVAALLGVALTLACSGERPYAIDATRAGAVGVLPDDGPDFPWRQWGGPGGDFKVAAGRLADSWPRQGPPLIWGRPLGGGYSAVAYDRGVLFTIYRDGSDDVVIALRADDGATIWEYRYRAKIYEKHLLEYGSGPNAMPLVLDDRVITLGYGGTLNCLDFATGRLLWSHDLIADFDGHILDCGNSASPIFYSGSVIVLVGGTRQAVVALDPGDGSAVWRSGPGSVSYGTPIVIDVDGQDQLVYMSEDEIIGIDARSGERLWSHPSFNVNRDNISTPLWGDDRLLFSSTQPDGGSRVLRLERTAGGTAARVLWSSTKISIHYWSALRLDDHVYASIGGRGLVFACIDVRTGEIVWRRRGFERANFVHTGDKTILLDAEGGLALVELSPEGMNVVSRVDISDGETWTVPTLVGTTLYVRDKKTIRALDLGVPTEPRDPSPM